MPRLKAANRPRNGSDQGRDQDHRKADEERDAGAVDQARKNVAAELVGAEEETGGAAILPGGRHADEVAVLLDGRVGGDEVGEDGAENQEPEDDYAEQRRTILEEIGKEGAERPMPHGTGDHRNGDVSGHGVSSG